MRTWWFSQQWTGALIAMVVLVAMSCRDHETPERKIRRTIDAGAAALEARDLQETAALLADGYTDSKGRTKAKLKQLALFAFQQGPILVAVHDVDIVVTGTTARVTVGALAMQGSATLKTARDLLPTNARRFDLVLQMILDEGDWKIAGIEGLDSAAGDTW